MKAYNYAIIDKRDDAVLESGLVVAEDFDTARTAALQQATEEWQGIPVDISSLDALKGRVIIAAGVREARA